MQSDEQRAGAPSPWAFRVQPKFSCGDCGAPGPQLLVLRNDVWFRLCVPPCPTLLCPACMRVRWGRDFVLDDLMPVPGNLGYVLDTWPERAEEFLDRVEAAMLARTRRQVSELRAFSSSFRSRDGGVPVPPE